MAGDGARLIVFEGGEGSGKSTQLRRLSATLASHEVPHRCFREPGGTPLGTEVRRILLDPGSRARTTTEAGRRELPGPARQTGLGLAEQVQADIRSVTGLRLAISSGPMKPRPGDIHLRLTDDAELGAEGYRLEQAQSASAVDGEGAGLFHFADDVDHSGSLDADDVTGPDRHV